MSVALNILIAEDDRDQQHIVTEKVRNCIPDSELQYGSTFEECIKVIDSIVSVDMAIVDLRMPKFGQMDTETGFEIIACIQKKFPDCKIIVYTIFNDESTGQRLRDLKLTYVAKDGRAKPLQDAIDNFRNNHCK